MRRAYHNTTAHYNVYFNGNEAYKLGLKHQKESYVEDFNKILPIFIYSDKESLSAASADMDRAIAKGTKLIKEHSITARPQTPPGELTEHDKEFLARKEYCNWVDDAYMLKGKAFFYKQDYISANNNFAHVVNEYKNEPIRFDASLWSVRCKIESKAYEDAIMMLLKLKDDPKFPESLQTEYYEIYADALIKSEQFDEATEKLEKAIDLTKKKKVKTRYTFILAQIYQRLENNERASELYASVLNMNPSYDIEFNARIRLATSVTNGSNNAEIKKVLAKLLRDEKNKEYRDQIYYAMANIAMQEGDEAKAIEYYQKSVQSSVSNPTQKALAYIALGKIYVSKRDYIAAQPFYDSAMLDLPDDYYEYSVISENNRNLNQLVKAYNILTYEDSVQRIAKMNPRERDKMIADIIKHVTEQEELQRQLEEEQRLNSMMYNQEYGSNAQKVTGSWYFYSQQAVNAGKQEFMKRWKNRKLEDNWRRSNKTENNSWADIDFEDEADSLANDSLAKKPQYSNKSPQYYTQNLPLNDSLMAISLKNAEDAMFDMGLVYMEKIKDEGRAIETFEVFVKRYPDSHYMPMVLYYLHNLYASEDNLAKADFYKSQLLQKYPDSKFAKALVNPNYLRELKAQLAKEDKLYRNTYKAYLKNDLPVVLSMCNEAFTEYPESELLPKFDFMRAMAVGKMADSKTLLTQLDEIINRYPDTEIADLAKNVMQYVKNNDNVEELISSQKEETIAQQAAEAEPIVEPEIYFYEDKVPHYYVVVAKSELVDVKRLKFNLINYNLDYFGNFDFVITDKILSKDYSMVIVQTLSEASQAMNYFQLINISDEIFEGIDKSGIEHFVISEKNFNAFVADKQITKYADFFYENYQ